MNKETLCTGCGATVTRFVDERTPEAIAYKDLSGSFFCLKVFAGDKDEMHFVELPPVAIKPEKQSAHTPQTWEFDPKFPCSIWIDGRWVATTNVESGGAIEERKARAEFIVRACNSRDDMLAALKEVVRVVGGTLQGYGVLEAPMNAAKTAISKAEDFMEEARRTR